jgi:O-antigen ligase
VSWFEKLLLYLLFASSFLVEVRLPVAGISASNLAVPLAAVALALCARGSVAATLRSHRALMASALAVYAWAWISAANGLFPALSCWYVAKYSGHLLVFASLLVSLHRRAAPAPATRAAHHVLVVLAVLGVIEYWWPDFHLLSVFRAPPRVQPRISSLLVWPNQLGVLMAIGAASSAALWRERRIARLGHAAALVLLLVALALSGSRSGWLVLTVLLLVLEVVHVLTARALAAIGAGFALLLITFPVPTAQLGLDGVPGLPLAEALHPQPHARRGGTTPPAQSLQSRLVLWQAALAEIEQRPLTGIGLEVFANRIGPRLTGQYWINTHNIFLNIATELGLVGLGLVVVFLVVLARSGDPRDGPASLPLLGVGLGQIFDCFLYDPAFMTFTVFFAARYASSAAAGAPPADPDGEEEFAMRSRASRSASAVRFQS